MHTFSHIVKSFCYNLNRFDSFDYKLPF